MFKVDGDDEGRELQISEFGGWWAGDVAFTG